MKPQELGLECEALDDFRANFSLLIRTLMDELTKRDLETGTITAKIKITRKVIETFSGQPYTQIKIEPDLGMKIGASAKAKLRANDGILMKYNSDGIPIVCSEQASLERYLWEDQRRDVV